MSLEKDILTIPEAAKYCAVDRTTMWRWIKSGNLQVSVTPGGHHRILKQDLESFLVDKGMYPLARKHFPKNKILVVDDDPIIQKALPKVLLAHNYETCMASDGFEAGIKIMQFKPDLVILDLIMPGMDGFEVCGILKGDPTTSHIKILILTGYDTSENRNQIMEAGADDILSKPAETDTLLQHIENLLGKYRSIRQKSPPAKKK